MTDDVRPLTVAEAREPLSHETAVFLVAQHSFDWWAMHDGTQEGYEAILSDTLKWREAAIRAEERERYRALKEAAQAVYEWGAREQEIAIKGMSVAQVMQLNGDSLFEALGAAIERAEAEEAR